MYVCGGGVAGREGVLCVLNYEALASKSAERKGSQGNEVCARVCIVFGLISLGKLFSLRSH